MGKKDSRLCQYYMISFHLYDIYRIGKSIEEEVDQWLPEARGGENGECIFSGCGFSFWGDENACR